MIGRHPEPDDDPHAVAAQWFARQRSGEMTDEARLELRLWLEDDPANTDAYVAVRRAWGGSGSVKSDPRVLAMREHWSAADTPSARLPVRALAACIAGALLVLGAIGGWQVWTAPNPLADRVYRMQTDAYPGNFNGRISYVSPALDPNTRTLQARIVVDNPGERLKKDMYCTVTVTAGSIANVIAVPNSSVLRDDNNQPFVYVATGANQFGRRDVDVGESQNGQTQILKGISAGERVVGDGSLFLQFANSLQH